MASPQQFRSGSCILVGTKNVMSNYRVVVAKTKQKSTSVVIIYLEQGRKR